MKEKMIWNTISKTCGRDKNEDYVISGDGTAEDYPWAVVCDGLGGHASGEIASNLAADGFAESYRQAGNLAQALEAANKNVACEADHLGNYGMATTLSAAVATDDGLTWISVGDSLIYHWSRKDDHLLLLNLLHNTPGSQHQLSSVVDGSRIAEIDMPKVRRPSAPGDVLVVASDGLDTLPQYEVKRMIGSAVAAGEPVAAALMAAVEARGKTRQDNTTIAALVLTEECAGGL